MPFSCAMIATTPRRRDRHPDARRAVWPDTLQAASLGRHVGRADAATAQMLPPGFDPATVTVAMGGR